jgi:hypothetical protein
VLDPNLGVVPLPPRNVGIVQSLLGAGGVPQENPVPRSAGHAARVQPSHPRLGVKCVAGRGQCGRPEGSLDAGAHRVDVDPDGR